MEEQFSDYQRVDGLQVAFAAVVEAGGLPVLTRRVRTLRVQRAPRGRSLHEACVNIGLRQPTPLRVMISCGEPSGDVYAGALAREILQHRSLDCRSPASAASSCGAPARARGDFEGLSVTGLLEVARVLPRTYGVYRRLVADATARKPDVFVAIDFPDFNFRLAHALRKLGVPVVYYISPQLWAWRPGRMKTMQRIADRVLVIFPFEEEIYQRAGVPVEWVGHPLLDSPTSPEPRAEFLARLGLDPARPVVALLPGSRINEVRAILPGLLAAARIIHARLPAAQFLLARAPHLPDELFAPLDQPVCRSSRSTNATDACWRRPTWRCSRRARSPCRPRSHECPMVVVYRLSPLTYRLGRPFVHVNTFAMVNLVAGAKSCRN